MPKKKKSTIQDIADQLGVSKSLVSFVLNGKSKEKRISDSMAKKVLEVAKRMNYRPNYLAKSLRTGRSQTIALIIADISNPFFAKMARFMEIEASKYEYKVIFANSDEDKEKFTAELSVLKNRQVDGFILIPPIGSEKELAALQKQKLPFVVVDRVFKNIDCPTVIINNYQAGYQATQRLIENDRRNIAILNVNNKLYTMQQRVKGYHDALMENGIATSPVLVKHLKFSHDKKLIMKAIKEIISAGADGLLFTTGKLTILGIECLMELGISIPEDISVISFDDMDAYRVTRTPISAIVQPLEQMSKEAITILMSLIEENTVAVENKNRVLDVDFVYRASCV
ncbi:MAG: LacI family DNA-binding transcriptional regulator [Phaeodactylibacter sp.]|nr:LacI family DNA-binding transcriptional regulator [Phaeodactylibacter sp.]MCB9266078.1 LacI family DNA-binding transcriptional regulator [Lewinellaceae bacterium]MCB9289377.1 LacI family DNA-binding transcriptional regulator [Lewinellaceae bacterium]